MPALSKNIVQQIWNKAVEQKTGLRLKMRDAAQANTLRSRLHSVRAKTRKATALAQQMPAELVSLPWDNFTVAIREETTGIWIHIEPDALFFAGIEVTDLKGKKLDDPFKPEES